MANTSTIKRSQWKIRKMALFTLFSVWLLAIPAKSQKYFPGGLGNSNLTLWLTASDPTTLFKAGGIQAGNGDGVAQWSDKSGSGKHAVQATAANQPVVNTNILNGYSGVLFNNPSPTQFLTGSSVSLQTMLSVRNIQGGVSAAIGNKTIVAHYQTLFASPANSDFSIRGGGNSTNYGDAAPFNGQDWPGGTGSPATQWLNGLQTAASSGANHILVSARSASATGTYSVSTSFVAPNTTPYTRGLYGGDAVYELLGYNNVLNTTQRVILENYEAALWGLGSLLPSSGYTTFTPPSLSSYNKNLVSVGYTSSGDNFLANPAGSTDGFGFSSGSGASDFMNSAGFLFAAHNGQTNTINANVSIPGISGSNISEWNRSWNLQKFGGNSSGVLTVNFNFNDYNSTTPATINNYSILYNSSDGSFSTGYNQLVAASSSTVSGNTVSFLVNASNVPNGYYTLIWSATLLPLHFTSFTLSKADDSNVLEWTVERDPNNSFFDVQRSGDGQLFTTINSISPSATENIPDHYNFVDIQPLSGWNYYRIKMTGKNEGSYFSRIVSDLFDVAGNVSYNLYPNPVQDILHIKVHSGAGALSIRVILPTGQLVRSLQTSLVHDIQIPFGDISAGVYFVIITGSSQQIIRTVIKEKK